MSDLTRALARIYNGGSVTLASVPDGFDALVSADLARGLAKAGEKRSAVLVHVARDAQRSRAFQDMLAFAEQAFRRVLELNPAIGSLHGLVVQLALLRMSQSSWRD